MSEIQVTEAEGWAGIAAALRQAQPGDRVQIAQGAYSGDETLQVTSGVTLSGHVEAELEYTGNGNTVSVFNAENVTIEGLNLQALRGKADVENALYNHSMIFIEDSSLCVIRHCVLSAHAARGPVIAAAISTEITVSENDTSGGYWGVRFSSSSGNIDRNCCHDSQDAGIVVTRYPSTTDKPSNARISNNFCYDNGRSGISLGSSNSEAIEGNTCWNNPLHGIILRRDEKSETEPSYARIIYNHCHDNGQSGIALFSSNSKAIEGNACWNNKLSGIGLLSSNSEAIKDNSCWNNRRSGIVLQREEFRGAEPSHARIIDNRCHDNGGIGIALISSNSEAIEGNACWNNTLSGIGLQPEQKSDARPSHARIIDNHCHDNGENGITLLSSNSEAIEGNACWHNKFSGIGLQREKNSDLERFHARISNNQLQGNQGAAIGLSGCFASGEGNRFQGNRTDSVEVDPDFLSLGPDDPYDKTTRNFTDPTLDLPALFLPELSAALAAATLPFPAAKPFSQEGLAGFLTSGCMGCFRTFWTGRKHAQDPNLAANRTQSQQHWWLYQSAGQAEMEPKRLKVLPKGLKATLINNATAAGHGKANWIALVITDDRDAESIREELTRKANIGNAAYVPDGQRIAPPVAFDMDSGNATLRERLSQALMRGKNWSGTRMALLTKTLIWPVLTLLMVAGALALSPWGATIATALAGLTTWERLTSALLVVAVALAFLSIIDLFLPRHLQTSSAGTGRTISDGIKQAFGGSVVTLFDTIARLVPQTKRDAWAVRADLNWQHKMLFHDADIATLYLGDVTCWRDGDLEWLGKLAGSLKERQKLNVLIELDGRLSVRPLLATPHDRPWTEGIALFLFDDADKLRLSEPGREPEHSIPVDLSLLGAGEEGEYVLGELQHRLWCPTDMIAALPLASAPTRRARLTIDQSTNATQLVNSELVKSIYPAANTLFTSGEHHLDHQFDTASILRPFHLADQSPALHTYEAKELAGNIRAIVGRTGYRQDVAKLLRGIWARPGNDSHQNLLDWREYITSSLRFGIWHAVREAATDLASPLSALSTLRVRRSLEAIRFLGGDLQAVTVRELPLHDERGVYEQEWVALRSAMDMLANGPDAAAVIGAWLGAEEACFGTLPVMAEALLRRIEVLLGDPVACQNAPQVTAGDAFCISSARLLIDLRNLDPRSRNQMLDRAIATNWRSYPASVIDRFGDWARGRGANSKSLVTLFADAQDDETVDNLIRIHRRSAVRTVCALANAATNHIVATQANPKSFLNFDDRMVPIARTLADFRTAWIEKFGSDSLELSRDFAKGASGSAIPSKIIYDYVTARGAAQRIVELLKPNALAVLEDLEGQFELELVGPHNISYH